MLMHSASGNGTSAPLLVTGAQAYRVSLDTADAALVVALQIRNGDSGNWMDVTQNGAAVSMSTTTPNLGMQGGTFYLRCVATNSTGGAFTVSVQDSDLVG